MIKRQSFAIAHTDAIEVNAAIPFVPSANDSGLSFCKCFFEVFQIKIIRKRNIISFEKPAKAQRLCAEKPEEPRHTQSLKLREHLAELLLFSLELQRVIDRSSSAAHLFDRAFGIAVTQHCDRRLVLSEDKPVEAFKELLIVSESFLLFHLNTIRFGKEYFMKKSWIAVAAATIMLFSSVPVYAATPDEAVLISQQDDLTPLYTTAPDSSLRDYSAYMTEEQSIFFYTQTTALALVAGYLILFKVKGIRNTEKMHRRWRKKQDK